jgi:predicted nucleic acid-binding protein
LRFQGVEDEFGSLKAEMDRHGKKVDDFDLVIASTAILLNYTLVTNNTRHFRHIPGLNLENWAK